MDSESKANQVSAPLLETTPGPVLVRMLEVVPSKGSEGGDKEATAFSKEVVRKGGIENSSPQGKKRTASDDSETMPQSGGRNLRQRVLRRGILRPNYALKGISPPPSRK